jgi:hypothetical protein
MFDERIIIAESLIDRGDQSQYVGQCPGTLMGTL